MAVAVGLDDGAQLDALAQLRAQPLAVARDRVEVDASDRAIDAHATSVRVPLRQARRIGTPRRADGSAAITSEAITLSALPTVRAATRPAAACSWTPAAAAANAGRPWARSAAITPVSTSPVPARRERGAASHADRHDPGAGGVGDQGVVALEHHHRLRELGGGAHVAQALALDLLAR